MPGLAVSGDGETGSLLLPPTLTTVAQGSVFSAKPPSPHVGWGRSNTRFSGAGGLLGTLGSPRGGVRLSLTPFSSLLYSCTSVSSLTPVVLVQVIPQ